MRSTLSLFNGIGTGIQALKNIGVTVEKSYISEIDKFANMTNEKNHPESIQLGDITKWGEWDIDWSQVDLVTAGFPCQAWSLAGKQLGDKDPRGALFWTTLDIIANVLKHNPNARFLMENVKMKKEFEDYITHHTEEALGYVEKTLINSALVTAQNRNRFYWTNFKVNQPEDRGILLRDIIEDLPATHSDVSGELGESDNGIINIKKGSTGKSWFFEQQTHGANGKARTLKAGGGSGNIPKLVVKCGAIRGRYLVEGKRQDHKMITAGLTEQRLELRKDDKTNTPTTVQKDNVVVYRPCELLDNPTKGGHVANTTDIKGHESIKRVYSPDGKAPTLTTMGCGHRESKVLVDREKSLCIDANYFKGGNPKQYFDKSRRQLVFAQDGNNLFYRKLTPLECERLQGMSQYTKTVEIILCYDLVKSFVDAVEKNPKLQKLVLSAENEELKEYAILASQNMNASQASIKSTALQDADMQTQEQIKNRKKTTQGVLISNVSSVENIVMYEQVESVVGSAVQPVFITITEGKITHYGKEVLPQKEQVYTEKMSGKIALRLSGKETMQNANDALSALEMMQTNQNSISITSFRLSTKNLEQILTISYWFAKSAIDGFTQNKTQEKTLYLTLIDGYTEGVSNTQRYKQCGNGWTLPVVEHIFKEMLV